MLVLAAATFNLLSFYAPTAISATAPYKVNIIEMAACL